jgi:hypothetical protein
MYDTDRDDEARQGALQRRQEPGGVPWRRTVWFPAAAGACLWLTIAAVLGDWALGGAPPEENRGRALLVLVLLVLALVRWVRRRRSRPIPVTLAPAQVRKLLRREQAYVHGPHSVMTRDGVYVQNPDTGWYDRDEWAYDPLLAAHQVRERRWAAFWPSLWWSWLLTLLLVSRDRD